jgi:hypothetical protein
MEALFVGTFHFDAGVPLCFQNRHATDLNSFDRDSSGHWWRKQIADPSEFLRMVEVAKRHGQTFLGES